MSALPKYERYKDSGVDWLGEIPEHWEAVPNRALLTEQREKVGKYAPDFLLLSLTLKGVIPRNMENPQGKFPAEFNTYTIVKPDDLVFCLFDVDETPRAVGHARHHGMITGAYNVYSPTEKINPGYLFYYYLFLDADKRLKPLYTGLRKTIQRGVFGSAKAPLPPKPEQDRIVAFLDQKTAEIDALIAKKQRQIELLDEQKGILINRAVTRGLNPNTKLKPSGIEWIGDIPEHREMKPIKRVKAAKPNAFVDGPFGSNLKSEHFNLNGEVFVIDSGFATRGKLNQDNAKTTTLKHFMTISRSEAEAGDLVIAKIGAWYGLCSILPKLAKRAVVSGNSLKLSVDTNYNDRRFIKEQICYIRRSGGTGILVNSSAQPALSLGGMASLQLACPPPSEQCEIADEIDRIKLRINKVTTAVKKQIESIKTLRSTLIAHAVTGRIKV